MSLTRTDRRAVAAMVTIALLLFFLAAAVAVADGGPDDPGGTTTTTEPTTSTSETTSTTEGTTTTSIEEPTTGTTPTTEPTTTTTSGDPMTVPAACRPPATNSGARLREDWPTDESTGPSGLGLDEDRLPASGKPSTWTITAANTVVEGVFHHGRIVVNAPNVKITGSVVCGVGALLVQSGSSGLLIEDSILVGEKGRSNGSEDGQPCEAAVGYGTYTLERTEVIGCADGLKVSGSVKVRDSYFHDQYRGGHEPGQPGSGTHNDTVQQANSPLTSFTFEHNSAYQDPCTSNRHFQMAPTANPGGTVGTWRITRNFFYGIRLINVDRGVRVADGEMTDNVVAGARDRGPVHPPYYAGDGMSTVRRSGNTFEDGSAVNSEPGVAYTCRSEAV